MEAKQNQFSLTRKESVAGNLYSWERESESKSEQDYCEQQKEPEKCYHVYKNFYSNIAVVVIVVSVAVNVVESGAVLTVVKRLATEQDVFFPPLSALSTGMCSSVCVYVCVPSVQVHMAFLLGQNVCHKLFKTNASAISKSSTHNGITCWQH